MLPPLHGAHYATPPSDLQQTSLRQKGLRKRRCGTQVLRIEIVQVRNSPARGRGAVAKQRINTFTEGLHSCATSGGTLSELKICLFPRPLLFPATNFPSAYFFPAKTRYRKRELREDEKRTRNAGP